MEKISAEADKMDLVDGKTTNMTRTRAYTVPDNTEEKNNMMKLLCTQEEADDFEQGEDLEVEKKKNETNLICNTQDSGTLSDDSVNKKKDGKCFLIYLLF